MTMVMDSCLLCDRPLTWGNSVAGIEISIAEQKGDEETRFWWACVAIVRGVMRARGWDRKKRRDTEVGG